MSEVAAATGAPEAPATGAAPVVETGASTAPGTGNDASGEQPPATPPSTEPPKWARDRIGHLTRVSTRAQNEAAELRARNAALEERERARSAPNGQQFNPQGQPQAQPQQRQEAQPDMTAVMREAQRVAAFNLKAETVFEKGQAIPGFTDALRTLGDAGLTEEAVSTVLEAADAPEKVLHYLGTHPDEAASLLAKSPVQMAKAIATIEHKLAQSPAVSNAPKPLDTPRGGGGSHEPRIGTAAWFEARNKADAERRQHR